MLRDRGSRYGTFVNGEPVTERRAEPRRSHPPRAHRRHRAGVPDRGSEGDVGTARRLGRSPTFAQMAAILNGLRALGSGRVLDGGADAGARFGARRHQGGARVRHARQRRRASSSSRWPAAAAASTLPGTSFTTSAKIPREVFTTGKSRIVGDLMDGNLAGLHDGTIAVGIRHVLCVPLQVSADGPGAAGRRHGPRDRRAVSRRPRAEHDVVAAHAGRRSRRSPRRRRLRSRARASTPSRPRRRGIDRDLRVAAEIQRALLPDAAYRGARSCDLAARRVPCRTVGGDFFDYLRARTRRRSASHSATWRARGHRRRCSRRPCRAISPRRRRSATIPAHTMTRINRRCCVGRSKPGSPPCSTASLEPDGRLSYCNAGQEPPLVVQARGEACGGSRSGGPVLGLLSQARPTSSGTATLEPGDLVVVCSDGVTEARNAAGEEFGRERLIEALAGCHGLPAGGRARRSSWAPSATFRGSAPQADDITAMVVGSRRRGKPPLARRSRPSGALRRWFEAQPRWISHTIRGGRTGRVCPAAARREPCRSNSASTAR